jgi:hypothetical protein
MPDDVEPPEISRRRRHRGGDGESQAAVPVRDVSFEVRDQEFVALGVIGIVMVLGIKQLEMRLPRWRPEHRGRP